MYDPDLHLFLTDDEVLAKDRLVRVVHRLKREAAHPVVRADMPWEGTSLSYGCVLKDEAEGLYRMWYGFQSDVAPGRGIGYATSRDGLTWEKPSFDRYPMDDGRPTNVVFSIPSMAGVMTVMQGCGNGPKFRTVVYGGQRKVGADWECGIYLGRSEDGIDWEIDRPAALPWEGDRTNAYWDAQRGVCMITSRQHHHIPHLIGQMPPPVPMAYNSIPGVKREVALWETSDFKTCEYRGVVLRADDFDPEYMELYSMTVFRYGRGFIGMLEMYHVATQRLDMQLAWSSDGRHWSRVARREPVFLTGEDDAWDSQWVCVTSNPPEVLGEKLRFWYSGAATKHGSGRRHRRAAGAALLRRDGFVALEAGTGADGELVTTALPADRPKKLQVNVRVPTGRFAIEVLGPDLKPLPGFSCADYIDEDRNGVAIPVRWRGGASVPARAGAEVFLRFRLHKGELFSYRWSNA